MGVCVCVCVSLHPKAAGSPSLHISFLPFSPNANTVSYGVAEGKNLPVFKDSIHEFT